METGCLLVSLEPSGAAARHGALALVDPLSERVVATRILSQPSATLTGLARGLVLLQDRLYIAASFAILVVDAASLAVIATIVDPRFRDLHALMIHENKLLVVNTGRDEVLVVDPHTHEVEQLCALPIPEGARVQSPGSWHHMNSIEHDLGGWLLCAHGRGVRGAIWRADSQGDCTVMWPPEGQPPLHAPHDATRVGEHIVFNESGRGALVSTAGRAISLGGWCRGLRQVQGGFAVGVNPFQDHVGPVASPCLALVRAWRLHRLVPLGLQPPLQTYAVVEAPDEARDWPWVREAA